MRISSPFGLCTNHNHRVSLFPDDVDEVLTLARGVREKTSNLHAVSHEVDGGAPATVQRESVIDELCLSSLKITWPSPASGSSLHVVSHTHPHTLEPRLLMLSVSQPWKHQPLLFKHLKTNEIFIDFFSHLLMSRLPKVSFSTAPGLAYVNTENRKSMALPLSLSAVGALH